jgi:hypothetical protein
MDLALQYLRSKGQAGYLHEIEYNDGRVIIAYSNEGQAPNYFNCVSMEEANRMLKHWEATGEFIIDYRDWHSMKDVHEVHHPMFAAILKIHKRYVRRLFPPQEKDPAKQGRE